MVATVTSAASAQRPRLSTSPVASHAPEITPGLESPPAPHHHHTAPTPTALARRQTPATNACAVVAHCPSDATLALY